MAAFELDVSTLTTEISRPSCIRSGSMYIKFFFLPNLHNAARYLRVKVTFVLKEPVVLLVFLSCSVS